MADKRITLSDVIAETEASLMTLQAGQAEHKAACEALRYLYQAQAQLAESQLEQNKLQLEREKVTDSERIEQFKLELERAKLISAQKQAKKTAQAEERRAKAETRKGLFSLIGTGITAAVGVGTFMAALNVDREGRFIENRNAFDSAKGNVRNVR